MTFLLTCVGKKAFKKAFNHEEEEGVSRMAWTVLNGLRFFTVAVLLTVPVAEWSMVVKGGVPEPFFVFHAIVHIFVSFFALLLITSEVGVFSSFFHDNLPLLSETHGIVWLGLAMIMIGCKLLGNLTENINSQENLTMPFWRLVIATGILNITFGFLNCIASWAYRYDDYSSRLVRREGTNLNTWCNKTPPSLRSAPSTHHEKRASWSAKKLRRFTQPLNQFNFGNLSNFSKKSKLNTSNISGPIPSDLEAGYGRNQDRISPIDGTTPRPQTAAHPAHIFEPPYPPSSTYTRNRQTTYSVASESDYGTNRI